MWNKKEGTLSMQIAQQISSMNMGLKDAFGKVKEEFEEHLQAINENADEIQMAYESMSHLETKMDKLSGRVDELQLMMRQMILSQIEITRLDDGKSMKLSQFLA